MNKEYKKVNTSNGGNDMENKTKILCNVTSCYFHENHKCMAETITVCCDNSEKPKQIHETACKSFTVKF